MKKLITTILLILSVLTIFGEKVDSTLLIDKLSFDYINIYREYHGVSKVKWSDENYKISVSHTNKLIEDNKTRKFTVHLFHSKTKTYENCMATGWDGKNPTNGFKNSPFYDFIKEYFNVDKEYLTKEKYLALLPIWSWHNSPLHKKNLLNKSHKIGSTHIGESIKKSTFKKGDTEYTYDWVQIFSVCNFN